MTNVPKFTAGQSLPINQTNWNQIAEATNHVNRTRTTKIAHRQYPTRRHNWIAKCKNLSDTKIPARTAVALGETLAVAAPELAFNCLPLKFDITDTDTTITATNIGVTLSAIGKGLIGDVAVGGPAYCYVNVRNPNDRIAIAGGTAGRLEGITQGAAGCEIISKPSGLGLVLCAVKVGLFTSPYATKYRGKVKDALSASSATATVDELIALDGQPLPDAYDTTYTLTVQNVLSKSADDNAVAIVEYNVFDDQWELTEVQC